VSDAVKKVAKTCPS